MVSPTLLQLVLLSFSVSAAATAKPTPPRSSPKSTIRIPLTHSAPSSSSSSLLAPVDQLTSILSQWNVVSLDLNVGLSAEASVEFGRARRRRSREERGLLSSVKGLLGGGGGRLAVPPSGGAVGGGGGTPPGPAAGLVGGLFGGVGGLLGGAGKLGQGVGKGLTTVLDEGWGGDVVRGRNGINDDYYGVLYVGTPPQSMKLSFDTGSTDIWLFSSKCSSCSLSNHTSYSSTASSTFDNSSSSPWSITYGDDTTIDGYTITETLSFPITTTPFSPTLTLPKLGLALATELSQSLYTHYTPSGLIGLAQARLSAIDGGESIFPRLVGEGKLKENVLGVRVVSREKRDGGGLVGGLTDTLGLQPIGSGEGDAGALVLGGIEDSWIVGGRLGLAWTGVTSSLYWGIPMTDVEMGGHSILDGSTRRRVILDTGTTIILTSTALASSINTQVPLSHFDPDSEIWTVPCKTSFPVAPNVFFELAGQSFGLPVEELAWRDDGTGTGTCLSGVQGGLESFTVLGDLFLRNHYLALSYGEDGETLSAGLGNRTDVSPIL